MEDKDRWTPRESIDGVYCAHACGRGCTRKEHDLAVEKATALATRMGDGWEPRVWENLGWHFAVEKGVASIRPPRSSDGEYTVFFNTIPQVVASAKEPEDAVGFAVQEARGIELNIARDCSVLSA